MRIVWTGKRGNIADLLREIINNQGEILATLNNWNDLLIRIADNSDCTCSMLSQILDFLKGGSGYVFNINGNTAVEVNLSTSHLAEELTVISLKDGNNHPYEVTVKPDWLSFAIHDNLVHMSVRGGSLTTLMGEVVLTQADSGKVITITVNYTPDSVFNFTRSGSEIENHIFNASGGFEIFAITSSIDGILGQPYTLLNESAIPDWLRIIDLGNSSIEVQTEENTGAERSYSATFKQNNTNKQITLVVNQQAAIQSNRITANLIESGGSTPESWEGVISINSQFNVASDVLVEFEAYSSSDSIISSLTIPAGSDRVEENIRIKTVDGEMPSVKVIGVLPPSDGTYNYIY